MDGGRRDIPPNPPRWRPNPDPASIHVPGLDTSAPVLDQIEQIEQLITVKLQNIDENFSKIHHLLSSRLLPAVKRYAVGTEPVREAAKFWTSFYEQAAQIKIPTSDDHVTVNDMSSEREDTRENAHDPTANDEVSQRQVQEPSVAATENSFMPGQAAFSSTPAPARGTRNVDTLTNESPDDPSWSASVESPLVRLDRELREFSKDEQELSASSHSGHVSSLRVDEPTPKTKDAEPSMRLRSDKGKGKEADQTLLRSVLRRGLHSMHDGSSTRVSPLKLRSKPKTPLPKEYNPFLPQDKKPADWSGVVDLRNTPLTTPQRHRRRTPGSRGNRPPTESDDSFDGLPPGMSPPVMMSPARPPRSSAELGLLKVGQTPTREASARITRDLVREIQLMSGTRVPPPYKHGHSAGGTESSMSTVLTPPSLSRYHHDTTESLVVDSSLESMMKRVDLHSTPGLRLRRKTPAAGQNVGVASEPMVQTEDATTVPQPAAPRTPVLEVYQSSVDSDSDSLDEINNTAHPSAAFLMASAHASRDSDDSFGSSNHSIDSLNDEDVNVAPIHPFARVMEGTEIEDDSFDDTFDAGIDQPEEETVFGVPPQQRAVALSVKHGQSGDRLPSGHGLKMLGEELLEDTFGIGDQMARRGVMETPTPAPPWPGSR